MGRAEFIAAPSRRRQPWGDNNPFYVSPTSIGGVSQGIAPLVSDNNPYAGIGDTIVLTPRWW